MEYASIISGCQLNENLEVFIDNFWSTDYFHVIPLQDSHYCYLQGTSKGYIQMALLCYISWIHTEIPKFAIYHYETDLFNILEQNFPEIEKFSELYSIIA